MARIAEQRDPPGGMHPVVQLVEVGQLPLEIRAREAAQLSHGLAPVGEAGEQLGVVALGAPLAFVDGRAAVGRVRDVDDDVVTARRFGAGSRRRGPRAPPSARPRARSRSVPCLGRRERGCGDENSVGDVACVLGRDGRAVYGVADGRFDSVGADDEVSPESGAFGERDGGGGKVVGGDAGGHEEGDIGVGICGGDEGCD